MCLAETDRRSEGDDGQSPNEHRHRQVPKASTHLAQMIAVDTSVWISAFRAAGGRYAQHLRELLDRDEVCLPIPVRIEILAGAGAGDVVRLHRVLAALPVLYPAERTWETVESWLSVASRAGHRFVFAG